MNSLLKIFVWFNGGEIYYKNGEQYVQLKKTVGLMRTGGYILVDYKVKSIKGIPFLSPVSLNQ
jgi:hypothetical protein